MQRTILAVDDDLVILAIYEALLGEQHNLYVVSSGKEALQFLKSGPRPELILLDITMPGMSGYEVCQKLRENPSLSHLKVILVSAKSSIEERIQGYDVGADDYIMKPFEASEFLAKINAFLRLKSAEEINKIKKDFLVLLSHEMRTPLNGIIGFAQILQESSNLGDEEKEFVEFIIECGHELLNLSEKTVLLSDLKSGEYEIESERIKLNGLFDKYQSKIQQEAKHKNLKLQIQSEIYIEIEGDPKLLHHAFEIVLDNAIKFAREATVIEVILNHAGSHIQSILPMKGKKFLKNIESVSLMSFLSTILKNTIGAIV